MILEHNQLRGNEMEQKKEVISYLFFGVLTTLANIVSYIVLSKLFEMDYKLATTIAWVISVLFAFITNKLYVFNSKETNIVLIAKEFTSFTFFRFLSYLMDLGMMVLMIEWLKTGDLIAKIMANFFVIFFNYFASKYVIFKKKESWV
jgi:putative flippase GtrA